MKRFCRIKKSSVENFFTFHNYLLKSSLSTNQYFFLILPPTLPQRIWQNMNLWIVKTSIAFIVCNYHILILLRIISYPDGKCPLYFCTAVHRLYSLKQISLHSEVHPVPVCLSLPSCEQTYWILQDSG